MHIFQPIEKAEEKLATTDLSISEIAYELGFEHLQSFSKLFKTKTNQSPLEFMASLNLMWFNSSKFCFEKKQIFR